MPYNLCFIVVKKFADATKVMSQLFRTPRTILGYWLDEAAIEARHFLDLIPINFVVGFFVMAPPASEKSSTARGSHFASFFIVLASEDVVFFVLYGKNWANQNQTQWVGSTLFFFSSSFSADAVRSFSFHLPESKSYKM
jgi:hypothetical protein